MTWHPGEVALQRRAGSEEKLRETGSKVIRDFLTEQHRDFFPLLPFAVLGTVAGDGSVWASLRAGAPGFLASPDPFTLDLTIPPEPDDPAEAGIAEGAAAALLGIDLSTRRRNRLNGTIRNRSAAGFSLAIEQSFGNCPKYITLRDPPHRAPPGREAPVRLAGLDGDSRRFVEAADTFFVASYADAGSRGRRQVDVSHRGGPPGFVRVTQDGALAIPDYPGNRYFNTLGNLAVNSRAGLVFVDFAGGDLLQLYGRTELLLEAEQPGWRFLPEAGVRRPAALPLRWA